MSESPQGVSESPQGVSESPEVPPVPNDVGHPVAQEIEGHHSASPKHPKRRRRVKWTLGVIGVVIVVLGGSVIGYAWYLNHEIHRIESEGSPTPPTEGADAGHREHPDGGLDRPLRPHGAEPRLRAVLTGGDRRQQRRRDDPPPQPGNAHVSILSIPRDLFVPNARTEGANKIDAALYEGPTQLVAAIEEDFGIPIQHYVELNFDTFANVVDALGGINMYFPEPVFDAYSGLNIMTPGCIHLNGLHALQVVRARHLQYKGPGVTDRLPADWPYETQSDLARIRRDHEFLRVLATAVSQARGSATRSPTSSSFGGGRPAHGGQRLLGLAHGGSRAHLPRGRRQPAPQLTLPVLVDQFGDYVYQGGTTATSSSPTSRSTNKSSTSCWARPPPRTPHRDATTSSLRRDTVGAQRDRRLRPSHHHRDRPASPRLQGVLGRGHGAGGPAGRDRRLVRIEGGQHRGGGPDRGSLPVWLGDHGLRPFDGHTGCAR